jgi:hypothetical protein
MNLQAERAEQIVFRLLHIFKVIRKMNDPPHVGVTELDTAGRGEMCHGSNNKAGSPRLANAGRDFLKTAEKPVFTSSSPLLPAGQFRFATNKRYRNSNDYCGIISKIQ